MLASEMAHVVAEPAGHERWSVSFDLVNHGDDELVHESWLPHAEFHSERIVYEPPILWSDALILSHIVDWAGGEVANAFLILRLTDTRIFFRLRPGPRGIVVEKVTTQLS